MWTVLKTHECREGLGPTRPSRSTPPRSTSKTYASKAAPCGSQSLCIRGGYRRGISIYILSITYRPLRDAQKRVGQFNTRQTRHKKSTTRSLNLYSRKLSSRKSAHSWAPVVDVCKPLYMSANCHLAARSFAALCQREKPPILTTGTHRAKRLTLEFTCYHTATVLQGLE